MTTVPTPTPQRTTQRRGTMIAAAMALLFIGVISWFIVRGGHGSSSAQGLSNVPSGPVPAKQGDPDSLLGSGQELRLDLTDREDPKRQAGELILSKVEPLPAGHYSVETPQAWLFLRDGRTAYIRGDNGKIYKPGNEPESGTITGHILIQLFDRRPDGKRIDRAIDKPVQTLTTDSLSFNTTLGEISTPDVFHFTSAAADCTGTGLEIVINQLRDRLEQLHIKQNGTLTMKRQPPGSHQPGGQTQAAAPGANPATPSPAEGAGAADGNAVTPVPATTEAPGAPPSKPNLKPLETMYRIVFDDNVVVQREQGTIKADQLQAWARLVDNKLPPGAIAPIKVISPKAVAAAPAPARPVTAATPTAVLPVPAPAVAAAEPEAEITLTWSGPCTITPLDTAPAELKTDQIALRFTAPKSGLVELADPVRNASGHAASIDYAATTRRLVMAGPGPASVLLSLPEVGESLEAIRLEMDLSSGITHIPGPGVLARIADPKAKDQNRQQVSWTEQADFAFETRDDSIVQALKQATCQGAVTLTDKAGTLRGGHLRADFDTIDGRPSSLTRLIVQDSVQGDAQNSGRLWADGIDVGFKPGPTGDPEPVAFTAQGHVATERQGARLTSEFLETTIARGPTGSSDITSAHATGSVQFADKPRNIAATADEMVADLHWLPAPANAPAGALPPRAQRVDLIGEHASISRPGETTINGTQMRVDGVARRLEVFGGGNLVHNEPGRAPAPGALLESSWTSSMTYDDAAGLIDCVGNVAATSWPEPLVRDRVDAERIKISLTPKKPGEPAAKPAADHSEFGGLRTARAFGSILESSSGVNARVESIRYAPDSQAEGGLRQEQVYYVDGPLILADNEAGTMDVPDRGRMILVDRRAKSAPSASPATATTATPAPTGDARGDSLFDWDGSMHMARAAGTIDMYRNVRLTHRSMDDGQVTNLVCEHLSAASRTAAPSTSQSEPQGPTGLIRATADGAVYAASGPEASPGRPFRASRELIADRADYDAIKAQIQATAAEGNQVTIFDAATGNPQSASTLFWDLKTDRITIGKPTPVSGSR